MSPTISNCSENVIPVVIVARCSRFCVHVGHIIWRFIPNERAFARISFAGQLATQFTSLRLRIVRRWDALTWFQTVCQTNGSGAFTHVAHEFLIAYRFVRFVLWCRALGNSAITEAWITATVVIATLILRFQCAIGGAAWALRWAAFRLGCQCTWWIISAGMTGHRITATVFAILLPTTIAFLARIDHTVTANLLLRHCKIKEEIVSVSGIFDLINMPYWH